ncbi:MAG: pilus assembly protein [Actinobacteria bacterium]|nr:pilus assembly protein [Actinomycetota bacterium]
MSRNRNELASETGSGIVGFVLVAPLVVAIFIAIGQIAMLVADKSVLDSAAVIGARTASAADASNADGRNAVLKVLSSRGAGFSPETIVITQVRNQGLTYISVAVTRKVSVPLLDREFLMTGRARAIDEASL